MMCSISLFNFQVLWPSIIVIHRGCWCKSVCFRTSSRPKLLGTAGFSFFYDCVAVDIGVITVLGAEVEGGVPVLPLFMLFLPRAQGEELSAGRYVHLVMPRAQRGVFKSVD